MFEITYSDNETFEAYQNAGKAHKVYSVIT